MRPLLVLCAALLAGLSCARATIPRGSPAATALPVGVEAISLLGDTLRRPELAPETRALFESRLAEARRDWERDTASADAIIWLGRRTAYLGRFRDAIAIYTRGLAAHPGDARLLRHRGHRWISVRELDRAVVDLERAAELVRGQPDAVEPDGLPNPRNTPIGTLHSNIWYHLGLAYYLRGDLEAALGAYREEMQLADNPDRIVSTSHWLYMTLRRLGREDEAAAVLAPIRRDMDIIENQSYHRLLLLYRGELPPDSLLGSADDAVELATVGYGVGNWHLYNGRPKDARRIFCRILRAPQWSAFGYIAAEAALRREGWRCSE